MNSQHRTVPADAITVDRRVQRAEGIDRARVAKMAADFKPGALGVLILSQREDGSLVILDGMHRHAASVQAGYTNWLDAIVYHGLSLADEAALFLAYNTKKDPSAVSRFKARVIMGDEVAVDIHRVLTKHGWSVALDAAPGHLAAIEAAESVYRTAAGAKPAGAYPEILDQTLAAIGAAWGLDRDGANGAIIKGVAQVIARFGEHLDFPRLGRILQGETPRNLVAKARVLHSLHRGTVNGALAATVVGAYNAKARTGRLPEWVWTR